MPGAVGPGFTIGASWGYQPYTKVVYGGARRLAGFDGLGGAPAHNPVDTTADAIAGKVVGWLRTLPPQDRALAARRVADHFQPGGAEALEAEARGLVHGGMTPADAVPAALSALVRRTLVRAFQTGRLPAWVKAGRAGLGGFGLSWSDVGDAFATVGEGVSHAAKGLFCGAGAGIAANLIPGATSANQDQLRAGAGCGLTADEQLKLAQAKSQAERDQLLLQILRDKDKGGTDTPKWVLPVGIGAGVLMLGLIAVVALKR